MRISKLSMNSYRLAHCKMTVIVKTRIFISVIAFWGHFE